MTEKINHWCVVCGKGYHACDACDETKSFIPWRRITDTPEHYQVYLIIKQYRSGVMSKQQAKAMLSDIGVTDTKEFKDDVKKVLREILKAEKPKKNQDESQNADTTAGDITEVDITNENKDTE